MVRTKRIVQWCALLLLLSGCGGGGVSINFADSTILLPDKIAIALFRTTWGGTPIPANSAVTVDVTTASTLAVHTGTHTVATGSLAIYLASSTGVTGLFSINGEVISVLANESWGEVVNKINAALPITGVRAEGVHIGGFGSIRLWQTQYGSAFQIDLADSAGVIQMAAGSVSASGVDAVASVTVGSLPPHTFTGGNSGNDGLSMTDNGGNFIRLTVSGNAVSTYAAAIVIL